MCHQVPQLDCFPQPGRHWNEVDKLILDHNKGKNALVNEPKSDEPTILEVLFGSQLMSAEIYLVQRVMQIGPDETTYCHAKSTSSVGTK